MEESVGQKATKGKGDIDERKSHYWQGIVLNVFLSVLWYNLIFTPHHMEMEKHSVWIQSLVASKPREVS